MQRNIEESRDAARCNYSGHAKPGTAILHTQLQAAVEAQGCFQTLQGQLHFIGLYHSDKATETSGECTFNPSTSQKSMWVKLQMTFKTTVS
jgi:hypothetical protein